jgi:predicted ATP-binding protein involved in virulence
MVKIDELNISGFTCFENNKLIFSPNINIFIGKNGTGKTHILKLIAASLSANELFHKSHNNSKERFENIIAEQLIAFFKPEQLGRLVRRQQGRTSAKVAIKVNKKQLSFGFSTNSKSNVKIDINEDIKPLNFLYIPPREMFSLYEGFLALYEKREISFDETFLKVFLIVLIFLFFLLA